MNNLSDKTILVTGGSGFLGSFVIKYLKTKGAYVQRAINDLLIYLSENGKDSSGEFFLGNIFGGFKNPARYVSLLEEFGYLKDICQVLRAQFGNPKKQIALENNSSERFKNATSLEESLSLFLSIVAEAISDTPAECFASLAHAFCFDSNRSDGNEFPIDPAKITFIS